MTVVSPLEEALLHIGHVALLLLFSPLLLAYVAHQFLTNPSETRQ